MNDVPLIYTIRGNLPIAELKYETAWDIVPGQYIKFIERYRAQDGEVIRESAHVYSVQGIAAAGEAANIGG